MRFLKYPVFYVIYCGSRYLTVGRSATETRMDHDEESHVAGKHLMRKWEIWRVQNLLVDLYCYMVTLGVFSERIDFLNWFYSICK